MDGSSFLVLTHSPRLFPSRGIVLLCNKQEVFTRLFLSNFLKVPQKWKASGCSASKACSLLPRQETISRAATDCLLPTIVLNNAARFDADKGEAKLGGMGGGGKKVEVQGNHHGEWTISLISVFFFQSSLSRCWLQRIMEHEALKNVSNNHRRISRIAVDERTVKFIPINIVWYVSIVSWLVYWMINSVMQRILTHVFKRSQIALMRLKCEGGWCFRL